MFIKTWNEEFTLCSQSTGATIHFNSWLPNVNDDLASYPHIILSSDNEWDPSKVKFTNSSESEMVKIESRNVASIFILITD